MFSFWIRIKEGKWMQIHADPDPQPWTANRTLKIQFLVTEFVRHRYQLNFCLFIPVPRYRVPYIYFNVWFSKIEIVPVPVPVTIFLNPDYVHIVNVSFTILVCCRLNNHRACVNGIAWAPHSSCHICTAGDDHQALIWDIQQMPRAIEDPILAYTAAEGEINQIQWGATQPDWIGGLCWHSCLS